jgi:uncharacterized SAM-binding protein YcdF (DUF218 family)
MALLALLIATWLSIVAWQRRCQQLPGWRPIAWVAGGGALLGLVLLLIDLESQKMASRLATPVGIAWISLLALALAQLRARLWWPGGTAAGCWLLLTLGGNAWIGATLLGWLERSVPPPEAQQWDAVAVLGGGTDLDPDGKVQLGAAGDRLRIGETLFRGGLTPLLVTTGSGLLGDDAQRNLAQETTALWTSWGVPTSVILQIPGPVNTRQEIERLAAEAHTRGWQRIALVSSGWHLPRALALARRNGLPADGIPADRRGRVPAASPLFLIPCGSGFEDVQLACNEILGRLIGR